MVELDHLTLLIHQSPFGHSDYHLFCLLFLSQSFTKLTEPIRNYLKLDELQSGNRWEIIKNIWQLSLIICWTLEHWVDLVNWMTNWVTRSLSLLTTCWAARRPRVSNPRPSDLVTAAIPTWPPEQYVFLIPKIARYPVLKESKIWFPHNPVFQTIHVGNPENFFKRHKIDPYCICKNKFFEKFSLNFQKNS